MRILGVIPARYASTRFPGKPLVPIAGRSMVMRVWGQCQQAQFLTQVVVATDDARIYDEVMQQGGQATLTSPTHPTGTDRLIEVAERMPDFEGYVNIQGDEPFIHPEQIENVIELLHVGAPIATLVHSINDASELSNPNVVKVAVGVQGQALYFSRSPIPHLRGVAYMGSWLAQYDFVKHVGIYGFSKAALQQIKDMPQSPVELAESLEQLRWLAHGLRIQVGRTQHPTYAIDSPADLARIETLIASGQLQA